MIRGCAGHHAALVLCLGLLGSVPACSNATTTAAQDMLSRTVPPGDAVPPLSAAVRSRQSLQFTWDVDTHLSAALYAQWLTEQLRDFQMVDHTSVGLHLGKLLGGDAYRLAITMQRGEGTTHVHVQLTVSPD